MVAYSISAVLRTCAGSRLKLSIVKEASKVASRLESCIELSTVEKSSGESRTKLSVEKSCTKLSIVYSKNRQEEKSSLSVDRRTVSCCQWLYNRENAVYCLQAHCYSSVCCVFATIPVPTKFCFLK